MIHYRSEPRRSELPPVAYSQSLLGLPDHRCSRWHGEEGGTAVHRASSELLCLCSSLQHRYVLQGVQRRRDVL